MTSKYIQIQCTASRT